MPIEERRANLPLLIALWVAISSAIAVTYVLWPKAAAVDFAVFWRAVHAAHAYAANEQPFVYPPTALLWFAPLRLVEVWPGYLLWTVLSVIVFALAAIWLYGRKATALAIISPAIPVGLIPGQTSLIAAAILFAAFASECRLCRGILLGALLTLKPQLAVVAPLFLIVGGEWLALGVMIATAGVMALLTTAVFGSAIWFDWLHAIPAFQHIVAHRGLSVSAVSPAAFATSLDLPTTPILLLGCAIAVTMAIKSAALENGERAATIAAASLFAAPYALRYDMVAVAPAMATIILKGQRQKGLIACVAYSATFGPLSLAAATAVVRWRGRRGAQPS